MVKRRPTDLVSLARVERAIHVIRGQKVMLDSDLAKVYGIETKFLVRAVKRNPGRFPPDFMFQLTSEEFESLRYQIGTLKTGRGQHRKYLPYAFTEHGAVMLASVLNSPQAVEASIFVVRAFIRMRELLGAHKELAAKITELDRRVGQHDESLNAGSSIDSIIDNGNSAVDGAGCGEDRADWISPRWVTRQKRLLRP